MNQGKGFFELEICSSQLIELWLPRQVTGCQLTNKGTRGVSSASVRGQ